MGKKNVVYEHRSNGGRFYTNYDPEKTYEDDEYYLIVATDVTDEMALELCNEKRNQNATAFLDDTPEELRDPKMDNVIRDMLGADPDTVKNPRMETSEENDGLIKELEKLSSIPPEGLADAKEFGIPADEVFKASNAAYEAQNDERKMEMSEFVLNEDVMNLRPIVFDENLEVNTIWFNVEEGKEVLKFCPNGDIYIWGRLAENDKEVVQGMRDFLESHNNIK